MSIDISAAFLQGLPLEDVKTSEGRPRVVWCRPPSDVWQILREVKAKYGLEVPALGFESRWLWRLLKAAYGLDDAPLLWRKALAEFLVEQGWQESHFDRCMFYMREGKQATGRLTGQLTLHIDDEGATGEEEVLAELVRAMTERFGELKIQEETYRHIGHEYNQSWHNDGSTTITDGQEFYSKTIQPVAIPGGPRTRLLVEQERSDL